MLSVIIATLDSERALVRTLVPLVRAQPPASSPRCWLPTPARVDETAAVADVAGCNFLVVDGLARKTAEARRRRRRARHGCCFCGPEPFSTRPGSAMPEASSSSRLATSAPPYSGARRLHDRGSREALSHLAAALGAKTAPGTRPHRLARLLSADRRPFRSAPPIRRRDLLRRIGRRRIALLSASAFQVGRPDT